MTRGYIIGEPQLSYQYSACDVLPTACSVQVNNGNIDYSVSDKQTTDSATKEEAEIDQ